MMMRESHQRFLQSFMSQGLLNAHDVISLYKKCCTKYGESPGENTEDERNKLREFVLFINQTVKVFHMEIKKGVNEVDGSSHYGLVNTTESSITLLATQYTQNELDFFKKLVEMVVDAAEGKVGSIEAIHITDSLTKKMSKADAEDLLGRLEAGKWITKEAGSIALGPRAILELEQYILDMYPQTARRCYLCKKLCLQGQTCPSCDLKIHHHCAKRFCRDLPEPRCPSNDCRVSWGDGQDTEQSSPMEVSGSQSRKRKERSK